MVSATHLDKSIYCDNFPTEQSSDTVTIAVVVTAAVVTVAILLLISVMAILIYKHFNGTRNCCELLQF